MEEAIQRECPFCMELIHKQAKKCRHCGETIDVVLRSTEETRQSVPQNNINLVNAGIPITESLGFSSKSRIVYQLLALFLGVFGFHNFYAGYGGRGAVQLLVTVFLGWMIIPLFLVAFWAFIEIFTVAHDANGLRMG